MAEKETEAQTYAKALTSFVENGKALLELAEHESKEGRLCTRPTAGAIY